MAEIVTQDLEARLQELSQRLEALEARYEREMRRVQRHLPENRVAIICFSGNLDKAMAALIIATGAASMGMQVSVFFTFWGLSVIKNHATLRGKRFTEKLFSLMLPQNMRQLGPSQMNFGGIGARMMRAVMRQKRVQSLEELFQLARELGVRVVACAMSMDVMGIREEELLPGLELGGVATYLADASKSKITLFI
ncbi:MAG: DsrE/DsrF/DrsH-like family protein [Bacteroidetes bacterium]|nr:DsrE/DsrF/DrsH-like family protein [Rhodothermia bacterium]MCS7154601.1 DsrE/DsrF/DrsH-like family protein [Bacteroidota bacterium]MCX7906318.1 DsrE/DsrF/DrsH-like family protein [Bacteroidota bacterium]MDW8137394.1 DsrE/DsrF/DrsH-like family protein [Bacteroidota bacterium]MDW8285652.1 DsrE/DsrF/DrsH-like family protein [Bacteroidota bacterium]